MYTYVYNDSRGTRSRPAEGESRLPHMASLSSGIPGVVDSIVSGVSNRSLSSASSASSTDAVSSSANLSVVDTPPVSLEVVNIESIVVVACSLGIVVDVSSSLDKDPGNDLNVSSSATSGKITVDGLVLRDERSGSVSGTFRCIDCVVPRSSTGPAATVAASYVFTTATRSIVLVRFRPNAFPILRGPADPEDFDPTGAFLGEEDGLVLRLGEIPLPEGTVDAPEDHQEEEDVVDVDTEVGVGTADVLSALPGLNLFRARGTDVFLLAAGPFFFFFFPSVKLGFLL